MKHFSPPPEPVDFDQQCRCPGNQWLQEHPRAKRPIDLWTRFKFELADGFFDLYAFSVMYIPNGTVDHFLSFKNYPHLAYEWSNYRYCAGWINSSKQNTDDEILDPFEVEDGWFEILLPSLQLVVSKRVPHHLRKKAEYTLQRLHLCDDERIMRQRRAWYRSYQEGGLTLKELSRKAPLIAEAIAKLQGEEG